MLINPEPSFPKTTLILNMDQSNPTLIWFIKLLSLQSDIISECLLSFTSPFTSLFSDRAGDTKETAGSGTGTPTAAHGCSTELLRKAVLGFLGACYVCLVLTTVMVVSIVLGVGLVNMWVEEPVYLKERLQFDYTDVHPYAVLDFASGGGFGEFDKLLKAGAPVGHTLNVHLVLVMPESDYNREVGMFQVIAEAISTNGDLISISSRPCMLGFRSLPIRLLRTFFMGIPLLLGYTSETQTISIPLLKYKERHHHRTRSIKISLVPRAGSYFLPQLYEANILVNSELPWRKELVRRWKWTFYVWTSLYIYLILLIVLFCCFRSIMFPVMKLFSTDRGEVVSDITTEEPRRMIGARDGEGLEMVRRWRQSKSKNKAMLLNGGWSEATSMSVTRDEDASVSTEDVGDSESICQ